MIKRKLSYPALSAIFLIILLSACKNKSEVTHKQRITEEQLITINKELVIKERERIESYILRKELKMSMLDIGIWYSITEEGSGDLLTTGNRVALDYSCSLLDGTICYTSEADGLLEVIVGKSDIPSGLNDALLLFQPGTTALVILPSNLAYGLVGDGNRIPSRATLIYQLKVIAQ